MPYKYCITNKAKDIGYPSKSYIKFTPLIILLVSSWILMSLALFVNIIQTQSHTCYLNVKYQKIYINWTDLIWSFTFLKLSTLHTLLTSKLSSSTITQRIMLQNTLLIFIILPAKLFCSSKYHLELHLSS